MEPTPFDLARDLYPYQLEGAMWLAKRQRAGLFDQQGLGKTAQAIIAADVTGAPSILVIAPTVVVHNWAREIKRWSPTRCVQVITSSSQKLSDKHDVVVTTHGMLLRPEVREQLLSRMWGATILDEAHFFRNHTARRTKLFYGLDRNTKSVVSRSVFCWVLTGTPMPNNPAELWPMLYGMAPSRLVPSMTIQTNLPPMTFQAFRKRFCKLVPTQYGDGFRVAGVQNVDELKARLAGFFLRRLQKDHLNLPPIRYGTVSVTLDEVPATLRAIEERYEHVPPEALLEVMRQDEQFSTWCRLCGIAKAEPAAELIAMDLDAGMEKIVVFAHHSEVIEILHERLRPYGVVKITGDTPAAKRQQAVEAFQTNEQTRVALCQIVAGGTGTTLTAANNVVFVETSWVPGENAQAACRVYRIGQKLPVAVRMLALANSVDELRTEALQRKTAMIKEVIS